MTRRNCIIAPERRAHFTIAGDSVSRLSCHGPKYTFAVNFFSNCAVIKIWSLQNTLLHCREYLKQDVMIGVYNAIFRDCLSWDFLENLNKWDFVNKLCTTYLITLQLWWVIDSDIAWIGPPVKTSGRSVDQMLTVDWYPVVSAYQQISCRRVTEVSATKNVQDKKLQTKLMQLNLVTVFAPQCYASAALAIMQCLSVYVSVCHIRTFCQNE